MDPNSSMVAFRGDADLVAEVGARQPAALLELYDRYSRAAYALAARMLGVGEQAEDCTHAAFLEIWRHPPPAEPTGVAFSSWLLAAVHRNAYARQRAAAPRIAPAPGAVSTGDTRVVDPPTAGPLTPARVQAHRRLAARHQQARAALAALHAAERTVLERAYLDGMTAPEIATHLQEPLVAVQNHIRAGGQHLRATLGGEASPPGLDPAPLRQHTAASRSLNAGPLTRTLRDETSTEYRAMVLSPPARPDIPGAAFDSPRDTEHRANQEKEELLLLLGHELRTPITVIKATIQLTRRRLLAAGHPTEAAHLDTVDAQLDRLTALVEYLLRAGQLNGGPVDLHPERFDLADLVREVGTAMQALSAAHTLIVHAPEHLVVEGDAERLAQVLRNLLTNAIKYSPLGGPVEVTLERAGAEAQVCVRDTGIGIPVAERDRVFERFHRASNVGTIPGFGLGLPMSREIVQAHHGRLWVGDVPGAAAGNAARPEKSRAEEVTGSLLCLVLPLSQEG